AIPGVEWVEGDRYRRSIRVDEVAGSLEIRPTQDGIEVRLDRVTPDAALAARLRRWFDLDADVATVDAHLARDPWMAALVAARPGMRVPGTWEPFEVAVRAIVGQQISVVGARTIAGRLVERAGDRLIAPRGEVVALFPRPEQLAAANLEAI